MMNDDDEAHAKFKNKLMGLLGCRKAVLGQKLQAFN